MIVKERDFPERLFKLAALNRRLPAHHKQKEFIEKQVGMLRAGYYGETSIDYYLQFLPKDYLIIQGIRLKDEYGNFQIDTLILTRRFMLILETKNISGVILFDDLGQVIRSKNDLEENFENPIAQVNLQHVRLRQWLICYKLPLLPIEKFVVYANSSAIIKNLTKHEQLSTTVIRKESLPLRIEKFENDYSRDLISNLQLQEMSHFLIAHHNPEKIDVLDTYNIIDAEIIKGVFCPKCNSIPMQRVYGKWTCNSCMHKSRTAYFPALYDYYFLYGEYITNQKCRDFLHIEQAYVAHHLLKKMNLVELGKKRGRAYMLEFPDLKPEMELY